MSGVWFGMICSIMIPGKLLDMIAKISVHLSWLVLFFEEGAIGSFDYETAFRHLIM